VLNRVASVELSICLERSRDLPAFQGVQGLAVRTDDLNKKLSVCFVEIQQITLGFEISAIYNFPDFLHRCGDTHADGNGLSLRVIWSHLVHVGVGLIKKERMNESKTRIVCVFADCTSGSRL
jgi:hypothetical protein